MIAITKDEAEQVRKYFPYTHIRRTTHKYYMEENRKAVDFLRGVRGDRSKKNGKRH